MSQSDTPSSAASSEPPTPDSSGSSSSARIPAALSPSRRLPSWRFWVVMLIQSALITAVPFKSALTYATGQTVTLQTAPVDPYDLLRGYSQTLRFEISDVSALEDLPGADEIFTGIGDGRPKEIYVTLQDPAISPHNSAASTMPAAWEPVAVSLNKPEIIRADQAVLRGYTYRYGTVRYGLETYYMPEAQRNDINQRIGQLRGEGETFVVDVKVDSQGNSVPLSLWIENEAYSF